MSWKFLLAIYSSELDSLIANKNNNFFRQKVSFKFTPKVNPVNTGKKENRNTDKPISIKRLPLPILAKMSKEVKKILKYFKTTGSTKPDNNKGKSYA